MYRLIKEKQPTIYWIFCPLEILSKGFCLKNVLKSQRVCMWLQSRTLNRLLIHVNFDMASICYFRPTGQDYRTINLTNFPRDPLTILSPLLDILCHTLINRNMQEFCTLWHSYQVSAQVLSLLTFVKRKILFVCDKQVCLLIGAGSSTFHLASSLPVFQEHSSSSKISSKIAYHCESNIP